MEHVNRDVRGFVDFEKMQGIPGISMANIVSNVHEVNMGNNKKLKSKITFNDGKLSGEYIYKYIFVLGGLG